MNLISSSFIYFVKIARRCRKKPNGLLIILTNTNNGRHEGHFLYGGICIVHGGFTLQVTNLVPDEMDDHRIQFLIGRAQIELQNSKGENSVLDIASAW